MAFLDPALWTGTIFSGRWAPGGAGELAVAEPATGHALGFTGSTEAGRIIGTTAAGHLTRVHLELGGNSPECRRGTP